MKKAVRMISAMLIAVLLFGTLPIISISSAEPSSPFIESVWKNSGDTVTLLDAESADGVGALPSTYEEYSVVRSTSTDPLISLEISWQDIIFTYSESGMKWDPHTHTYKGVQGSEWIANENSNYINITNNSDIDVLVSFEFDAKDGFDDLCGSFYDRGTLIENSVVISPEVSKEIEILLGGSIPSNTADRTPGGTVRITVSS
jgi:hypothetical protein